MVCVKPRELIQRERARGVTSEHRRHRAVADYEYARAGGEADAYPQCVEQRRVQVFIASGRALSRSTCPSPIDHRAAHGAWPPKAFIRQ